MQNSIYYNLSEHSLGASVQLMADDYNLTLPSRRRLFAEELRYKELCAIYSWIVEEWNLPTYGQMKRSISRIKEAIDRLIMLLARDVVVDEKNNGAADSYIFELFGREAKAILRWKDENQNSTTKYIRALPMPFSELFESLKIYSIVCGNLLSEKKILSAPYALPNQITLRNGNNVEPKTHFIGIEMPAIFENLFPNQRRDSSGKQTEAFYRFVAAASEPFVPQGQLGISELSNKNIYRMILTAREENDPYKIGGPANRRKRYRNWKLARAYGASAIASPPSVLDQNVRRPIEDEYREEILQAGIGAWRMFELAQYAAEKSIVKIPPLKFVSSGPSEKAGVHTVVERRAVDD